MGSLNVLYFCQLYPPVGCGGGEYVFSRWAKEMARRGHTVCMITQNVEGERDKEVVDGVKIFRVGPRIVYDGRTPPSMRDNLGFMLAAVVKGCSLIRQDDISIIHSNTYAPAFSAALCASVMRKPWIITVHDVFFLQGSDFWRSWASQRGLSRAIGIIGPVAEKLLLRLSPDAFHTVSEQTREDLKLNKITNVHVIPNGVDIQEYDRDAAFLPNKQVVYLGRLVNYKNLEVVIEAMRNVAKQSPESRLMIVGDGPHRAILEELTDDYGLENQIIFTGFVTHEEKVRVLHESAFLVLPSIAEGFGVVVAEAFACARPALVSKVAPLTELVTDGVDGICLPPFDSGLWSQAILGLLNDPARSTAMGQNGLLKTERYSLKKTVDGLERLYREVILRRTTSPGQNDITQ